MPETLYRNRRAVTIENDRLRITATLEGAHIAEILHKPSNVNPLWTPPWPTIEPSAYDPAKHPEYGGGAEAHLLAGILGHNICLDTFGGPSPEEAAAGMPVHGEGPIISYAVSQSTANAFTLTGTLPLAQLRFTRTVELSPHSPVALIHETIENLSSSDHPIAWTQHVTLGPPFLESGKTQFRMTATHSKVGDASFNDNLGPYVPDADFAWPHCPLKSGGTEDFRTYTKGPISGGFSTHLMDPVKEYAHFLAWSPSTKVVIGYIWKQKDFPWLARWEEHCLRTQAPWNGKGITCGMEFGVSPFVESRRNMVERGGLFGVPGYRWVTARAKVETRYCAFIASADAIPETVTWDHSFGLKLG